LGRALVPTSCGRIGAKGIALFARTADETAKFDLKLASGGKAGEFLGVGSLCVIPPTIHPETKQPYRWTDKALLEVDWQDLPLIDPDLIKAVFASEHLSAVMNGNGTHTPALQMVGQLTHITDDDILIERIITAALPVDYKGNTKSELLRMVRGARRNLDSGKWVKRKKSDNRFPEVNKKGVPLATLPNTKTALTLLGVECKHDLFKLVYFVNGHEIESYVGEISDPALLRLRELIYERFNFDPSTDTVSIAVRTLANHHRFHPVRDYLDGLSWDGVSRIDNWLVRYGGAEDTPYTQAVGALTLTAAVRRVRKPGCKFDELLVLENPDQGTNKS